MIAMLLSTRHPCRSSLVGYSTARRQCKVQTCATTGLEWAAIAGVSIARFIDDSEPCVYNLYLPKTYLRIE